MSRYEVIDSGESELAQWGRYYDRLKVKNVYSLPAYIKFLEWHYGDEAHLFVYRDGDTFAYFPYFIHRLDGLGGEGLAPTVRGRCHIHSSWYYGGPLASVPKPGPAFVRGFVEAWTAHARAIGAVSEFTRFDANLANHRLLPDAAVSYDRDTVYVDLTQDEEAIWAGFHQSNRWAVNRARRDGVEVSVHGAEDDDSWRRFVHVYGAEMVRKDAPAHLRFGPEYFDRLRRTVPEHVRLLVSTRGGETCGGVIVIFGETDCYGFLSATEPRFWKSQVNNLGWAHAVWWAKQQGFRVFDLMGGRPGVFRFKSHFSRDRSRFYVRKAIYDQGRYDALVAARGRSGAEEKPRFPAYL